MSPWEELGIEEGQLDKKLIKSAYAKRLKMTRPDENPEGFQRLHKAYKYLLDLCNKKHDKDADKIFNHKCNEEPEDEAESTIDANEKNQRNDALFLDASPIIYQDDKSQTMQAFLAENEKCQPVGLSEEQKRQELKSQALQDKAQQVVSQLDALMASRQALNSKPSWTFLYDHDYIFDDEFNAMVSVSVFERVGEYNLAEFDKDKNEERHIKPETVKYLDDIFGWSNDRDWFEDYYDEKTYKAIFNLLDYHAHQTQQKSAVGAEVVNDEMLSNENVNKIATVFIAISVAIILIILFMKV